MQAAVFGPDQHFAVPLRPFPFGKREPALGLRVLEFVLIPVAALAGRCAGLLFMTSFPAEKLFFITSYSKKSKPKKIIT